MNVRVWRRLKLRLELVHEPRQTFYLAVPDGQGGERLVPMYKGKGAVWGDNHFVKTGGADVLTEVHNPPSGPIKGGFTS